jgi:hypothetical protein
MNNHLKTILSKMCSIIDISFERVDITKPNWFLEHSWTPEQAKEFARWMFNFLKKKSIERELYGYASHSDKMKRQRVEMFLFQYGWKYK